MFNSNKLLDMDDLVNYEVSKLLKQKGVVIKCSHYYVLPFQNFVADFVPKKWSEEISSNELRFLTISKMQPHLGACPTQSLVAKVLREDFDIHVFPSIYSNSNDYEFKIYQKGKHLISAGVGLDFKSAFDLGLIEALKLIKE